jgi:hypothetical protein
MLDDRHKRHALRQRMHSAWTVATTVPAHLSLMPVDEPAWTRASPPRPIPLYRPWWARAADYLQSLIR